MLKFTKAVFAVLGLAVLAVAIYFLVKLMWRWNTVMGYAQANHATVENPRAFMFITACAALVAGLLLGIGIAMPRRTAHSIRKSTREELAGTTAPVDTTRNRADNDYDTTN